MKKLFLISYISICAVPLAAQSKLEIKAPDSLAYFLMLGEHRINSLPCTVIAVPDLPAAKTTVVMNFPAKPSLVITQDLVLKKYTSYLYEVAVVKGKHKLALVSESTLAVPELPESAILPVHPIPLDSAAKDSITSFVEAGDCPYPVSGEQFDKFQEELTAIPFETRKLEKMRAFSSDHCLRVEQVRSLLAQLSMEDDKLKLLDTASRNVFDKAKLTDITQDFLLEKNRVKAALIIQQVHPE